MKPMHITLPALTAACTTLFSAGILVQEASAESLGERNRVLTCFYECKDGPQPDYWVEVTSLMLVNPANRGMQADVVLFDGNQNILGVAQTALSAGDLDEINICRTLYANGLPVPPAGAIGIAVDDPQGTGGTYGWVKNVVGKFFKTVDEPFEGRVTGIGKTECRVVPESAATAADLQQKVAAQGAPVVAPLFIEDTGPDGDVNLCCGPNDQCIDVDGITSVGRGGPGSVDVLVGAPLSFWAPVGTVGTPPEGIDYFDNDTSCSWTLGDDLHLEDPVGACGTAIRNTAHDLGQDCKVLDLNNSLINGQPVDVDLERNEDFRASGTCATPGIDPRLGFFDANGDGGYNNGEDIVLDINGNGICD
jgi:hypothetical protein